MCCPPWPSVFLDILSDSSVIVVIGVQLDIKPLHDRCPPGSIVPSSGQRAPLWVDNPTFPQILKHFWKWSPDRFYKGHECSMFVEQDGEWWTSLPVSWWWHIVLVKIKVLPSFMSHPNLPAMGSKRVLKGRNGWQDYTPQVWREASTGLISKDINFVPFRIWVKGKTSVLSQCQLSEWFFLKSF